MNRALWTALASYHNDRLKVVPEGSAEWRLHGALLSLVVVVGLDDAPYLERPGVLESLLESYKETLEDPAGLDHLRRTPVGSTSLWELLDA